MIEIIQQKLDSCHASNPVEEEQASVRHAHRLRIGGPRSRIAHLGPGLDVVGAQRAVTGTLVTLISDTVSLLATLGIMLALEWRLTIVSIFILLLTVVVAIIVRVVGLRFSVRHEMTAQPVHGPFGGGGAPGR